MAVEPIHHHFDKATDVLKQEHRAIEEVLDILERLATRAPRAPLQAWERTLDFIRNFADRCHHLKEEEIFFPALEGRGIPVAGGPIGMMKVEHEEGRAHVKAMMEALARAKGEPDASRTKLIQNALAYLRLLREHIRKEDEILFAMADEVLTPQDQRELLKAFEEHEAAAIGSGVHEEYLKLADELAGLAR